MLSWMPWGKRAARPPKRARRCRPTVEPLEERCLLYDTAPSGLPLLNSLPGAPTAIFLDFDGDGTRTPYDVDGNPSTFNATEQAQVVEAWRQVALYFAVFDVNVTTVFSSTPKAWVVISNSITGPGFSSVGAFPNASAQSFNPSGDARTRQSGIAHEAGHNFGNNHQSDWDLLGNKINEYSSGYDTLHGPLMGVDYAGSVHKWFIGHPAGSPGTLQDDLAVIANRIRSYQPAGGDGYRADDFGNTIAAASPLPVYGSFQYTTGILERLADVDAFSFTTPGGAVRVEALPDRPSGVDLKIEIYSSGGVLLAAKDGATNDQQLTVPLAAGTYYVLVSSHGDYGDVGAYTLDVSTLPGGWDTQDVGAVGQPGYAGWDAAGAYSVGGSGSDIFGTSDQFRFTYVPLTGDGSITARVTANEATDPWAKAGVMIRNGLAANAANAFMTFGAGNGTASFQARASAGGSTASTTGPGGITAPYWLRLVRTGNTFTGFRSADGVTWVQQGSATIAMGATVFIGLAVTAHNNGQVNDAAFDNVSLTGTVGPAQPTYGSLPAPTGLALAAGTGTAVNLSWNAVAGATGYAIDRSADGVGFTQVATTAAGVTTYDNGGLAGGQRWFYRVSALSGATRSVPSDVASLVNRPGAPFNVTLTPWTSNRAILNWRDVAGDTGYRVERSTDGVTWAQRATVGRNVPSYTDTGLTPGVTYYYRVRAMSALGDSLPSTVVWATNSLGVDFTTVTTSQVALRWAPVVSARYRVERSTDGVNFTPLATATGTTYTDNAVVAGTTYYYRVLAENTSAVALSPWSYNSASTTAPDQPPMLAALADQTVPSSQTVLAVALSATDPDGDPITFSATAQSLAYVLTQQTGTLSYLSAWDNYGGRGDRWLQAAGSGQWYFLLPDGGFYRWEGGAGATGTLLGTVGVSYYSDPTRMVNPPADQPRATLSISGSTLTITRDAAWVSAIVVTVTASDGRGGSDSKTFTVTVTSGNRAPVLAPISDRTVPSTQQVVSVPLSATDPDGDAVTFSAVAQSLAYVLTQQTGTLTYFSAWDNYGGRGDKWLQAAGGQWYFLLANGELYRWDGGAGAAGTLLGNVGSSYYADPTRLTNPPASQPRATLSISGSTLTITRDLAWVSAIVVTVTASDGQLTDSKTFTVTVTA